MVPENDLKFYDVVEMDIPTNYINITRNAFDIPHFTTVHGWQTVELVDFGLSLGWLYQFLCKFNRIANAFSKHALFSVTTIANRH